MQIHIQFPASLLINQSFNPPAFHSTPIRDAQLCSTFPFYQRCVWYIPNYAAGFLLTPIQFKYQLLEAMRLDGLYYYIASKQKPINYSRVQNFKARASITFGFNSISILYSNRSPSTLSNTLRCKPIAVVPTTKSTRD